jgi:hypothetical protein
LGRTFEVVHRIKQALVKQGHELFILVERRICTSQITVGIVLLERGELGLVILLLILILALDCLQVSLADRLLVQCGHGVVAQNASDLHLSSKNRKLYNTIGSLALLPAPRS